MLVCDPQCNSDLLRRLDPKHTSKNVDRICTLVPDLTEDLLSSVDQPLETRRCKKSGRDYLLCDYNRDGDSYRSPWSNEFDPPISDGTVPSEKVRKMEEKANEAFDIYRDLSVTVSNGTVEGRTLTKISSIDTMRAGCLVYTFGIWTMALLEWCC